MPAIFFRNISINKNRGHGPLLQWIKPFDASLV